MREKNKLSETVTSLAVTFALTKTLLIGGGFGILWLVQFLMIQQAQFNSILKQVMPY